MRLLRFCLTVFSVLSLAGWHWLRQPDSVARSLPPVSFTAFSVDAQDAGAGTSLAVAARQWPGVTAVTYNPASRLLALGYTGSITEPELRSRIERLTQAPVCKMNFSPPDGPQCPVPHALLAEIPRMLLVCGLTAGLLSALMWYLSRRY